MFCKFGKELAILWWRSLVLSLPKGLDIKYCKAGDITYCQLAQLSKLSFRQLPRTVDLFAILRNASILRKQGAGLGLWNKDMFTAFTVGWLSFSDWWRLGKSIFVPSQMIVLILDYTMDIEILGVGWYQEDVQIHSMPGKAYSCQYRLCVVLHNVTSLTCLQVYY